MLFERLLKCTRNIRLISSHNIRHASRWSIADKPRPLPQEFVTTLPGEVEDLPIPDLPLEKGEEHRIPLDIDYMHVSPMDEMRGLVFTGLHPDTAIDNVRDFVAKYASVRHLWIYRNGIACIRFNNQSHREAAEEALRRAEIYPFHIYDPQKRNWTGTPPLDQQPIDIQPLTTVYTRKEPKASRILMMRTMIGMIGAYRQVFGKFSTAQEQVHFAWTKHQVHNRWIWEYYIKFPSINKARAAKEAFNGKKLMIPSSFLSTKEKLEFPFGKSVRVLLQHTGLEVLPKRGTQDTPILHID